MNILPIFIPNYRKIVTTMPNHCSNCEQTKTLRCLNLADKATKSIEEGYECIPLLPIKKTDHSKPRISIKNIATLKISKNLAAGTKR